MNKIDSFLDFLKHEKRYSKYTLNAYRIDLSQFQSFCEEAYKISDDSEVSHHIIRSWLVQLVELNRSAKSINRKLSSIKSYFKYLLKKRQVQINPAAAVVAPKIGKKLPVYVEEREMDQLFLSVDFADDFWGTQEKFILELFYALGIRLSELVNLTIDSFDLANSQLKVKGKGNKERLLPMHPQLLEAYDNYCNKRSAHFLEIQHDILFLRKNGQPIYPRMVQRIVKKNLEKVSTITNKSPHVLRHSFATHLSRMGADLNAIKDLLGHTSLAATQIYTHNNIEQLKEIHRKTHPKA